MTSPIPPDTNLPECIPIKIAPEDGEATFQPIKDVSRTSSFEELQDQDLVMANGIMQALYMCWGQVKSIHGVCRLADVTFRAIEQRRKILQQPFGVSSTQKGTGVVDPLP